MIEKEAGWSLTYRRALRQWSRRLAFTVIGHHGLLNLTLKRTLVY